MDGKGNLLFQIGKIAFDGPPDYAQIYLVIAVCQHIAHVVGKR